MKTHRLIWGLYGHNLISTDEKEGASLRITLDFTVYLNNSRYQKSRKL